jgi:uncharacterized delta-60 repeat protein
MSQIIARCRLAIALSAGLLLVVIPASAARAGASGRLDMPFGHRGEVLTTFSGGSAEVAAEAIQSDGKIVAAGDSSAWGSNDFALVRYGTKGTLDATFGTGGNVLTDFGGVLSGARAVAIQSDGMIVAAGLSREIVGGVGEFALARYDSNGSLDATFSGGQILTAIEGSNGAQAVAIQSDGKIVAGGGSTAGGSADFALVRYNSNGTLDGTFGIGGEVLTSISPIGSSGVDALVIESDGKIVVAGDALVGDSNLDFALARYDSDGTLDPTFGADGTVLTDFSGSGSFDGARALAIQSDGKIVAGGSSDASGESDDFALARYETTGSLDPTFGTGGEVLTDFSGSGSFEEAAALAIQSDGKIVAAGGSDASGGSDDFALARYDANGSLDTTFSGGKVLTEFSDPGGIAFAFALTIQSDGKIVAAGYSTSDFALARYRP